MVSLQSLIDRDHGEFQEEEISVTSTPIFEGHLYVRIGKKQWQWRLFRFDGSCFTCLSTRKVKLPPNTLYKQENDLEAVNSSYYSFASPLLATPKNKHKRPIANDKTEMKYYQLPEWAIDIIHISSISLLKRTKRSALQSQYSKCFSIRTLDSNCVILKAQKQKDLERWLFVLTKMWKFTQAVKNQVLQSSQSLGYPATAQMVVQQTKPVVADNTPITTSHAYDPKYRSPILSNEKVKVIEEWRKSLAELMANDPTIRVSSPPPIEPIPDDDTMSIFTDMTSVSNRTKTIKRRPAGNSKRSAATSRSLRRNKIKNAVAPENNNTLLLSQSYQELPSYDNRPNQMLRKRRSDDVRNWMNNNNNSNNRPLTASKSASIGSSGKKINNQHKALSSEEHPFTQNHYYNNQTQKESNGLYMNYFQDVVTVCEDETCPYEHHQQLDDNKLIYHSSIRGKKLIQINQGEPGENIKNEEGGKQRQQQRQLIEKEEGGKNNHRSINVAKRASMPLLGSNVFKPQHKASFDQHKIHKLSPLQSLPIVAAEDEEDMSLADLQRSLRQIGLHNNHTRTPSASSILDSQHQKLYSYTPPSIGTPSIVAPAVPAHQYAIPIHQQPAFYLFKQQKKLHQSSFPNISSKAASNSQQDLRLSHNNLYS